MGLRLLFEPCLHVVDLRLGLAAGGGRHRPPAGSTAELKRGTEMLLALKAMIAARMAREFLERAKGADGSYRLDEWPEARGGRRNARHVRAAVVRLRIAQRLTMGFLDPVDDSLFLTAGLRRMGIPASFHLGRELAPTRPPAGYFAWVQHRDDVVSTSLPVADEYVEVHRSMA